jgi:hypothetical protein
MLTITRLEHTLHGSLWWTSLEARCHSLGKYGSRDNICRLLYAHLLLLNVLLIISQHSQFVAALKVFAVTAFTVLGAHNAGLETFTVLL